MSEQNLIQIRDLPGPRGLPLLGNVLQMDAGRMQLIIERWAKAYGTPYKISLGLQKAVIVSDEAMIRQAMKERPEKFRRFKALESIAKDMGVIGLFPAEGASWKRQRRAWMQALNFHQVKPFFAKLNDTTAKLQRRWETAAEQQEAVDVQAELMRYTVDITTEFAFGHPTNTLEEGDDVLQKHLGRMFYMLNRRLAMPVPYWRWFKLPADRELDRSIDAIREFANEMIEDTRKKIADNPALAQKPSNLLEALLVARDEDGSTYSDEEIFGNTIVALLAGEDTTANSIAWAMHMLATHPEVQKKLQNEIDAVLGSEERWTRLEDSDQLQYLDAVTSETLRIRPVAPLIFLCANEDLTLGNLALPAGTNVILALRHLASLEESYSNPDHFNPDRWLEDKKARMENQAPMPFGGGPRLCPGRNLAQMEIRSVIAMLARNFDIELYDEREVSEVMAFTLVPKNLRIRFKRRKQLQQAAA